MSEAKYAISKWIILRITVVSFYQHFCVMLCAFYTMLQKRLLFFVIISAIRRASLYSFIFNPKKNLFTFFSSHSLSSAQICLNWVFSFHRLCVRRFCRNRGGWPTVVTQDSQKGEGQTQFGWHRQNMFSKTVSVSVEEQREGAEWVSVKQSRYFNVKRQSYKFIYLLSPDPSFHSIPCWDGWVRHNALACHNIEKNWNQGERPPDALLSLQFPHN